MRVSKIQVQHIKCKNDLKSKSSKIKKKLIKETDSEYEENDKLQEMQNRNHQMLENLIVNNKRKVKEQ